MTTIACVVIADGRRKELLDTKVLPSLVSQGFDEVVVVGDHHSGEGYRHLPVRGIFNNTLDALIKRDVGMVATDCEWVLFLCDDHALAPEFVRYLRLQQATDRRFDGTTAIGVPQRFTMYEGSRIELPMGLPDYCGGHAGVFHRSCIQDFPHCLGPWHPNWDAIRSQVHVQRGYRLVSLPDCFIQDLEPEAHPWQ